MDNFLLFAVNLDQEHPQGASFEAPLWEFGLPDNGRVEAEDLLTGHRFTWDGKVQQVWLDPAVNPCAVWRIRPPGLCDTKCLTRNETTRTPWYSREIRPGSRNPPSTQP